MSLSTRKKLKRFNEDRSAYMQDCRMEYGYTQRARSYAIGTNKMARMLSLMLGFGLPLAFYSSINAAMQHLLQLIQSTSATDLLELLRPFITG